MKNSSLGKTLTIILGLLTILIGCYCVFRPLMTYLSIGYFLIAVMMIDGIGNIILWNERRKMNISNGWALAGAIISIVFGVLLILNSFARLFVDITIVYIIAFWLIITGIVRIGASIKLRKVHKELGSESPGKRWWVILILGLLMAVFGIFSLFNPMLLALTIGINIGIAIVISGVNVMSSALN